MKKHHLQELKSETEILESSVKETNTKESNTKETVRDSKPTIDVSGFDLYSAE